MHLPLQFIAEIQHLKKFCCPVDDSNATKTEPRLDRIRPKAFLLKHSPNNIK